MASAQSPEPRAASASVCSTQPRRSMSPRATASSRAGRSMAGTSPRGGRHPPARLGRACADLESGIAPCPGPLAQGEPVLERRQAGLAACADQVALERPLRVGVAGRPGSLEGPLRPGPPTGSRRWSRHSGRGRRPAARGPRRGRRRRPSRPVPRRPAARPPRTGAARTAGSPAPRSPGRTWSARPPSPASRAARAASIASRKASDRLIRAADRRQGAAQAREASTPVGRLDPGG